MVRWDDLPHVVWNGLVAVVVVIAVVAIVRDPAWRFRRGWFSKGSALFFGLALTISLDGFVLPLGAIVTLYASGRRRSTVSESEDPAQVEP